MAATCGKTATTWCSRMRPATRWLPMPWPKAGHPGPVVPPCATAGCCWSPRAQGTAMPRTHGRHFRVPARTTDRGPRRRRLPSGVLQRVGQALDRDHFQVLVLRAATRRVGLGHDRPPETVRGRLAQALLAIGYRPDLAGQAHL